jgi:hypothetical protein
VVLAQGTYQGTFGVYLQPKKDINWAEITESNGMVRSHPVEWLDHIPGETPRSDQGKGSRHADTANPHNHGNEPKA